MIKQIVGDLEIQTQFQSAKDLFLKNLSQSCTSEMNKEVVVKENPERNFELMVDKHENEESKDIQKASINSSVCQDVINRYWMEIFNSFKESNNYGSKDNSEDIIIPQHLLNEQLNEDFKKIKKSIWYYKSKMLSKDNSSIIKSIFGIKYLIANEIKSCKTVNYSECIGERINPDLSYFNSMFVDLDSVKNSEVVTIDLENIIFYIKEYWTKWFKR